MQTFTFRMLNIFSTRNCKITEVAKNFSGTVKRIETETEVEDMRIKRVFVAVISFCF